LAMYTREETETLAKGRLRPIRCICDEEGPIGPRRQPDQALDTGVPAYARGW